MLGVESWAMKCSAEGEKQNLPGETETMCSYHFFSAAFVLKLIYSARGSYYLVPCCARDGILSC